MTNVPMLRPLRLALLADAAASGATAVLLVGGAGLLEPLLGLPTALMREAGMLLIPYVMFVLFVASRPIASVAAVNGIIGVNAVWTAASVLLLVSGWVSPSVLGIAFGLAQAAAVGAFAVIQYACLRQAGRRATEQGNAPAARAGAGARGLDPGQRRMPHGGTHSGALAITRRRHADARPCETL